MALAASLACALPASGATADAAVDDLRLALELARHGDRVRDPLALLMAARIQKRAGARYAAAQPAGATTRTAQSPTRATDPQALLDRAQAHAGGRADLLALIAEERAASTKGADRGPLVDYALVPVGAALRVVVTFVKGVRAVFGISGDSEADLDVEVLDATGRRICNTGDSEGPKQCDWVPEATGDYQIRVRNRAQLASEFTFFHN
jgi:hypothetical protein